MAGATWKQDGVGSFWNDQDYALTDAKGRTIGGKATIWTIAGRFQLSIWATRNGETFGAIPRATTYDTIDEAKTLGDRKLEQSRKRFAAKVASGKGRQFAR